MSIEELHKTRYEFGVLKWFIFIDGHYKSKFLLKLKDDTFFTQNIVFIHSPEKELPQSMPHKCIQWYAALRLDGHFRASIVARAALLGGLVGTVRISVGGADRYVDQVFCPKVNIRYNY